MKNKHLRFIKARTLADIVGGSQPKTRTWKVRNSTSREDLGLIRWFGAWRQYAFDPDDGLSFEKSCLRAIADFCERQTKKHYTALKKRKTST